MKSSNILNATTVTTQKDARITPTGRILRKLKVDELPQLWNVIKGEMSIVGPRPDVKEMFENLSADELAVLNIKPGITGPASIKYRNEESLLASVDDADAYNRDVIFPDKIRINIEYGDQWSILGDIKYILITLKILPCPRRLNPPSRVLE